MFKNKLSLQLENNEDLDLVEQSNFAPCIDGPVITVERDDVNCVFFGSTQFVPRYAYVKQVQF